MVIPVPRVQVDTLNQKTVTFAILKFSTALPISNIIAISQLNARNVMISIYYPQADNFV